MSAMRLASSCFIFSILFWSKPTLSREGLSKQVLAQEYFGYRQLISECGDVARLSGATLSDGNLAQTHGMRALDFGKGVHVIVQPKDFTIHSGDQNAVLVMDDKVGEEGYARR